MRTILFFWVLYTLNAPVWIWAVYVLGVVFFLDDVDKRL